MDKVLEAISRAKQECEVQRRELAQVCQDCCSLLLSSTKTASNGRQPVLENQEKLDCKEPRPSSDAITVEELALAEKLLQQAKQLKTKYWDELAMTKLALSAKPKNGILLNRGHPRRAHSLQRDTIASKNGDGSKSSATSSAKKITEHLPAIPTPTVQQQLKPYTMMSGLTHPGACRGSKAQARKASPLSQASSVSSPEVDHCTIPAVITRSELDKLKTLVQNPCSKQLVKSSTSVSGTKVLCKRLCDNDSGKELARAVVAPDDSVKLCPDLPQDVQHIVLKNGMAVAQFKRAMAQDKCLEKERFLRRLSSSITKQHGCSMDMGMFRCQRGELTHRDVEDVQTTRLKDMCQQQPYWVWLADFDAKAINLPETIVYNQMSEIQDVFHLLYKIQWIQLQMHILRTLKPEAMDLLQQMDPNSKDFIRTFRNLYGLLCEAGERLPVLVRHSSRP